LHFLPYIIRVILNKGRGDWHDVSYSHGKLVHSKFLFKRPAERPRYTWQNG